MNNSADQRGVITFGWCFDHGRLHRFAPDLDEGGKVEQCSAAWAPLDGTTDEEALAQKELIWGPAQFFDQLDLDRQGGLVGMMMARKHRQGATSL